MTSRKIRTAIIYVVIVSLAIFTEGKTLPRYRRGTNELQRSYIVHYNSKGEPLTVAGFEDFVRVLNGQRGSNTASFAVSPFAEKLEYSSPSGGSKNAGASEMKTSTETTVPHQPGPLAAESSTSQPPTVDTKMATASPESAYVVGSSTEAPSKLPHQLSLASNTTEASASPDKPPLILALGHDAATTSFFPSGGLGAPSFSSDLINLVTPSEYSPSKTSVSNFGFPYGASLAASKLISLQPRIQTVLNYAPSSLAVRDYVPSPHASYLQGFSTPLQRPYAQMEGMSYSSYPAENTPIILRQSSQLIDIGQGLGQGYASPPEELPVNMGSWGGVDYGSQRGINHQTKPIQFSIGKQGYGEPFHSSSLSKIGFGPGSW